MVKLVGDWPAQVPFGLERLGGPTCLLALLKLAGSEHLYSGTQKRVSPAPAQEAALRPFRERLALILNREHQVPGWSKSLLPPRVHESQYTNSSSAQLQGALP